MAATNYTPIQLYFSTTASAVPLAANLAQGELAINITDGKLYYEDNAGVVQVIATKGAGTIGGSTTQIQYNNAGALAGNAAMTFNSGTNTTTLTTLNLTNALGAIYGGTAQSTYAQGDVLYASASNTLAKLGIGATNYILTSTGSVPQWSAPSSIIVQTATNLAGGAGGSVPYQSAVDTTTFLAIGAANRVMTSSGTAPQWVTSLTGLTGVSSSSITNTSLTSGRVVVSTTAGLQADDADLTFDGTTLSAGGFSTVGLSTLVKTVTIGNSNFNGTAVFAAATPAKLYIGTGTVTDTTSAIGATNAVGAISSLAITPIAATNTSVTYTNAATLYIAGAPSAGTNVTITNPYSLYVAAGDAYFGGTVTAGTVNLTTLDLTNLEVTNIKAKDGTASATIANSTGVMTIGSSILTTTDINGGTIDGTTIGANVPAVGVFTNLRVGTATSDELLTINGSSAGFVARITNTTASNPNGLYINSTNAIGTGSALRVDSQGVSLLTLNTTGVTLAGGLTAGNTIDILGANWLKFATVNTLFSTSGVGFFLQAPDVSTTPLTIRGNSGTTWATVSSTGLAVTGTLSATSTITASSGASGSSIALVTIGTANNTVGGSGNQLLFNYGSNASSRSWKLVNDFSAFGDLCIAQSTTQTGSTYTSIANFNSTGLGIKTTPIFPLDVYRGSSGVVLNLEGVGAYSAETGITFSTGRAKISGFLESSGGTPGASLRFYTQPNSGGLFERVRITSDGNTEIGTPAGLGRQLNVNSATDGYTMGLLQTGAATSGTNSGIVFQGYYDGSSITDMASIRGGKENTTSGNFGGKLTFFTRTNGGSDTERVRITSTGQALFGLTGSAAPAAAAIGIYANGNSASYGIIGARNGSARNTIAVLGDSNFECGYIGTSNQNGTDARFEVNGLNGVQFSVSGNERARVTATGYFKADNSGTYFNAAGLYHEFRQTANSQGLVVAVSNASFTSESYFSTATKTAGTDWLHFYGTSDANTVANVKIFGNGNIQNANNSYGSISDSKLKENIVDASPKLADLMQVKVRNYNLIGSTTKQIGVVAQELETVFPAMVDESHDRDAENNVLETTTKSVKYSVFVPMLIKAMQEQQAIIESLKARLDAANL